MVRERKDFASIVGGPYRAWCASSPSLDEVHLCKILMLGLCMSAVDRKFHASGCTDSFEAVASVDKYCVLGI